MTTVFVEYEEILDEETTIREMTRITFNRDVSKKEKLIEYLYHWKPIRAKIISVKSENDEEILNGKTWDEFFQDYAE
ncbi:hypothetical protein HKD31_15915 [Gluconobacter sp. R71646]|uniref:Uncharacterized protein n=1 Tax=Gluconobacter potus TaxID=2724927 RepID=A0ABR9YRU6_9PROT|nr:MULTISPECIES: hypothetical protein [Gluconobacter]MBF0866159.1 hypothetical protein [Gluconobacter sp. R71656]MBF0869224.1 hypothetical protein [Gluconobacter sp. R75628]MBF0875211.1 hypothetical protein [Gluconobacter sp. R75629]MBF0884183.1 hypothetical protein [Gluconobacter potus]